MKWSVPKEGFTGLFIKPTQCEDWGSCTAKLFDATFDSDNDAMAVMMTKTNMIDLRCFFRSNPFYGMMFFDQSGRLVCCHTIRCQIGGDSLFRIYGNVFNLDPVEIQICSRIFKKHWFNVDMRDTILARFINVAGNYSDVSETGPPPLPQWGNAASRTNNGSTPVPPDESTDSTVAVQPISDAADGLPPLPVESFIRGFILIPPVLMSTVMMLSHPEASLVHSLDDLWAELSVRYDVARLVPGVSDGSLHRVQAVINWIVVWPELALRLKPDHIFLKDVLVEYALSFVGTNVPHDLEKSVTERLLRRLGNDINEEGTLSVNVVEKNDLVDNGKPFSDPNRTPANRNRDGNGESTTNINNDSSSTQDIAVSDNVDVPSVTPTGTTVSAAELSAAKAEIASAVAASTSGVAASTGVCKKSLTVKREILYRAAKSKKSGSDSEQSEVSAKKIFQKKKKKETIDLTSENEVVFNSVVCGRL